MESKEFVVEANSREGRDKGGNKFCDFEMLTIGEHNAARGR